MEHEIGSLTVKLRRLMWECLPEIGRLSNIVMRPPRLARLQFYKPSLASSLFVPLSPLSSVLA